MTDLSICICTLAERAGTLAVLLRELEKQIEPFVEQVEVLVEMDNREQTTGAKRNKLYNRATGLYVCSIDDDDEISPNYVSMIMHAIKQSPDAIGFLGYMTTDGYTKETFSISRFNPYIAMKRNGRRHFLRFNNHLSPIKRDIAIQYPFPDQIHGEDYAFAHALYKANAIKTEVMIHEELYHYKYKSVK